MDVRIFYEDTDCGGMVYYANYLKYFERIRTLLIESFGVSLVDWLERGVHFVVVNANINYKYPSRYGDVLTVRTRVSKIAYATVEQEYRITRADGRLIVTGQTTLCLLGLKGTPIAIPADLREYFAGFGEVDYV